jgi:uncharacterized RDD family membrane protein YckC
MKAIPDVSVIDNYTLAQPSERMLAFIIDYVVAFAIFFIPYAGPFLSFFYLIFRDGIKFFGNKSIGKKIMGIKVINDHTHTANLWTSFKRNIIFLPNILLVLPYNLKYSVLLLNILLILIEVYFLYTSSDSQRLGDNLANTVVIEDNTL